MLVYSEYVYFCIALLTVINHVTLACITNTLDMYLLISGMPGVNTTYCDNFFECFTYECRGDRHSFNFTDCSLAKNSFISRSHTGFAEVLDEIQIVRAIIIAYSIIQLLLLIVYYSAHIGPPNSRSLRVLPSVCTIVGELVVRVAIIRIQWSVNDLEPYLPNFVTDTMTLTDTILTTCQCLLSVSMIIMVIVTTLTSKDPSMSAFEPFLIQRDRKHIDTDSGRSEDDSTEEASLIKE